MTRRFVRVISILVSFAMAWFFVGVSSGHATESVWYVATTGDDLTGTGTLEKPFVTIQKAIDAANAGDTIQVQNGTYEVLVPIVITKPLTILGAPGDSGPGPAASRPIIDRKFATTSIRVNDLTYKSDAFNLVNNVSNVTISGFEIKNLATNYLINGSGVAIQGYVESTRNISITDNYIHNVNYGVLAGNDSATGRYKLGMHSNWTVANNVIENFGAMGIELTSTSNSLISNNLITMTGTESYPNKIGIFSWIRNSQTNLTISGNTIAGQHATYPYVYILADATVPGINASLDGLNISNNLISATTNGTQKQVRIRSVDGPITNVRVNANSMGSIRVDSASIDASDNWWGQSTGAAASQVEGLDNTTPYIESYLPDPTKTGLAGFWPLRSQSIDFDIDASTVNEGSSLVLSAEGGQSGNPIRFTIKSQTVCTVTTDSISTAVEFRNSGVCLIEANQDGNSDYQSAAPVSKSVLVLPAGSSSGAFVSTPVIANTSVEVSLSESDETILEAIGNPLIVFTPTSDSTNVIVYVAQLDIGNVSSPRGIFSLGSILVDIQVSGATPDASGYKICLTGSSPTRLWHFENSEWRDITIGYEGDRVCGIAASLSPFATGVPIVKRVPAAYLGPLVTNAPGVQLIAFQSKTVSLSGQRLSMVESARVDSMPVRIISLSATDMVLEIPPLSPGVKDLVLVSSEGSITVQGVFNVVAAQGTIPGQAANVKVNVLPAKGRLVIYAVGLDGARVSWKVGGKWGQAVVRGEFVRFFRPTVKKGSKLPVEIYLNGLKSFSAVLTSR